MNSAKEHVISHMPSSMVTFLGKVSLGFCLCALALLQHKHARFSLTRNQKRPGAMSVNELLRVSSGEGMLLSVRGSRQIFLINAPHVFFAIAASLVC